MKIHKAAGIVIQDRKLLVEKSVGKDFYISPGGSIEEGETAKQALVRELEEEFTINVEESDLEHFGDFEAEASNHPGRRVVMNVFVVKEWKGSIKPASEVEIIEWVTSKNEKNLPLGSIFEKDVIPQLHRAGLID